MPRPISETLFEEDIDNTPSGIRRSNRLAQNSPTPLSITTRRTSSASVDDVATPRSKTRRTSVSSETTEINNKKTNVSTPTQKSRKRSASFDSEANENEQGLRRSSRLTSSKLAEPDVLVPSKIITRRSSTTEVSSLKRHSKVTLTDSDLNDVPARTNSRRCVSESPTKNVSLPIVNLTRMSLKKDPTGPTPSKSKSPPRARRRLTSVNEEPGEALESAQEELVENLYSEKDSSPTEANKENHGQGTNHLKIVSKNLDKDKLSKKKSTSNLPKVDTEKPNEELDVNLKSNKVTSGISGVKEFKRDTSSSSRKNDPKSKKTSSSNVLETKDSHTDISPGNKKGSAEAQSKVNESPGKENDTSSKTIEVLDEASSHEKQNVTSDESLLDNEVLNISELPKDSNDEEQDIRTSSVTKKSTRSKVTPGVHFKKVAISQIKLDKDQLLLNRNDGNEDSSNDTSTLQENIILSTTDSERLTETKSTRTKRSSTKNLKEIDSLIAKYAKDEDDSSKPTESTDDQEIKRTTAAKESAPNADDIFDDSEENLDFSLTMPDNSEGVKSEDASSQSLISSVMKIAKDDAKENCHINESPSDFISTLGGVEKQQGSVALNSKSLKTDEENTAKTSNGVDSKKSKSISSSDLNINKSISQESADNGLSHSDVVSSEGVKVIGGKQEKDSESNHSSTRTRAANSEIILDESLGSFIEDVDLHQQHSRTNDSKRTSLSKDQNVKDEGIVSKSFEDPVNKEQNDSHMESVNDEDALKQKLCQDLVALEKESLNTEKAKVSLKKRKSFKGDPNKLSEGESFALRDKNEVVQDKSVKQSLKYLDEENTPEVEVPKEYTEKIPKFSQSENLNLNSEDAEKIEVDYISDTAVGKTLESDGLKKGKLLPKKSLNLAASSGNLTEVTPSKYVSSSTDESEIDDLCFNDQDIDDIATSVTESQELKEKRIPGVVLQATDNSPAGRRKKKSKKAALVSQDDVREDFDITHITESSADSQAVHARRSNSLSKGHNQYEQMTIDNQVENDQSEDDSLSRDNALEISDTLSDDKKIRKSEDADQSVMEMISTDGITNPEEDVFVSRHRLSDTRKYPGKVPQQKTKRKSLVDNFDISVELETHTREVKFDSIDYVTDTGEISASRLGVTEVRKYPGKGHKQQTKRKSVADNWDTSFVENIKALFEEDIPEDKSEIGKASKRNLKISESLQVSFVESGTDELKSVHQPLRKIAESKTSYKNRDMADEDDVSLNTKKGKYKRSTFSLDSADRNQRDSLCIQEDSTVIRNESIYDDEDIDTSDACKNVTTKKKRKSSLKHSNLEGCSSKLNSSSEKTKQKHNTSFDKCEKSVQDDTEKTTQIRANVLGKRNSDSSDSSSDSETVDSNVFSEPGVSGDSSKLTSKKSPLSENRSKFKIVLPKELQEKLDIRVRECLKEEEDLEKMKQEMLDKYTYSDSDLDDGGYILSQAEEGEESDDVEEEEDSGNEIRVIGEDIGFSSSDAEEEDIDESSENSFIDDEEYSLLSTGEEELLDSSNDNKNKTHSKKNVESKEDETSLQDRKVYRRILSAAESSDESDEADAEQVSDQSSQSSENVACFSDEEAEKVVDQPVSSVDSSVKVNAFAEEAEKGSGEYSNSSKDDMKGDNVSRKRTSSLTIQENISLEDITNSSLSERLSTIANRFGLGRDPSEQVSVNVTFDCTADDIKSSSLSERINSVVDQLCLPKRSSGKLSLNVSLGYTPNSSLELLESTEKKDVSFTQDDAQESFSSLICSEKMNKKALTSPKKSKNKQSLSLQDTENIESKFSAPSLNIKNSIDVSIVKGEKTKHMREEIETTTDSEETNIQVDRASEANIRKMKQNRDLGRVRYERDILATESEETECQSNTGSKDKGKKMKQEDREKTDEREELTTESEGTESSGDIVGEGKGSKIKRKREYREIDGREKSVTETQVSDKGKGKKMKFRRNVEETENLRLTLESQETENASGEILRKGKKRRNRRKKKKTSNEQKAPELIQQSSEEEVINKNQYCNVESKRRIPKLSPVNQAESKRIPSEFRKNKRDQRDASETVIHAKERKVKDVEASNNVETTSKKSKRRRKHEKIEEVTLRDREHQLVKELFKIDAGSREVVSRKNKHSKLPIDLSDTSDTFGRSGSSKQYERQKTEGLQTRKIKNRDTSEVDDLQKFNSKECEERRPNKSRKRSSESSFESLFDVGNIDEDVIPGKRQRRQCSVPMRHGNREEWKVEIMRLVPSKRSNRVNPTKK